MKEFSVKIKGNPYRITGLDARQSQEFIDFAVREMVDPVKELVAIANELPEEIRKDFYKDHLDKAIERKKLRGSANDPDLEKFIKTPQGFKKLFGLMFKKHHPHLTEDEVYNLVHEGVEEHGQELFSNLYESSNKVPLSEDEVENTFFRR